MLSPLAPVAPRYSGLSAIPEVTLSSTATRPKAAVVGDTEKTQRIKLRTMERQAARAAVEVETKEQERPVQDQADKETTAVQPQRPGAAVVVVAELRQSAALAQVQ